ncbi:hypothetical protein HY621_03765 [Candidatus Uhrbacteria bacterium]|nr:hypothetical protein [Candidatus Uhrbacteria bacterium]
MADGKSRTRGAHEALQVEEVKEEAKELKEQKRVGAKEHIVPAAQKLKEPIQPIPLPSTHAQTVLHAKSLLQEDIEGVLAEGLTSYYQSLTPSQRSLFKEEGEKIARKIETLIQKTRVKVTQIILLIRTWLTLLPGINRYFVEKEAKIKADKIILLKEEQE